MINLSEVVNDPDFAQDFSIQRSSGGSWQAGKWITAIINVPGYGVIQPATPEELEQVPEGDRVKGALSFHSEQPLYETHTTAPNDQFAGTSDMVTWQGQKYRFVKLFPWEDFGYYKAIGVRMSGQ